MRVYLPALGLQCLHFAEEYFSGFSSAFPQLYGGAPYSRPTFVVFNLVSYIVFAGSAWGAYKTRRSFLILPALFFVVYGTMGNAIAHSFWSLRRGGYFPGLYTSLPYWVLGPCCIRPFLLSWGKTAVFIVVFGAVLIAMLALSVR